MSALFPLGQIVATPGALAALERAKQPLTCFVARHAIGDWGELDPTDVAENDFSMARVPSTEQIPTHGRITPLTLDYAPDCMIWSWRQVTSLPVPHCESAKLQDEPR